MSLRTQARTRVLAVVQATPRPAIEVLGGALLLAIGGRCVIVTPFTPVPFTLQTLFLAMLVLALGRRAWRSVAAYLAMGLTGVPVFAYGGGPWYVASPTFGYLLGFLLASLLAGPLAEKHRSFIGRLATATTCMLLVYLAGWSWLTGYLALGGSPLSQAAAKALVLGVLPFVAWDLSKALIAALVLTLLDRSLAGRLARLSRSMHHYNLGANL